MKVIARMTTRLAGEGDGMILCAAMKGHDFFKPNTVYEMKEIFGEVVLREVGKSVIADEGETYRESPISHTWGTDAGQLMAEFGGVMFLSREEYAQIKQQRKEERKARERDF